MERAGLVVRTDDEKDARVSIVSLTDEGRRISREASRLFMCADEKMLEGFTDDECRIIVDYLIRMRENLIASIANSEE